MPFTMTPAAFLSTFSATSAHRVNERPFFCCGQLPSEGHTAACLAQNDHDSMRDGDTEEYRLPDGSIVSCDATATKGAAVIDFTLAVGRIVRAVRVQ